MTVRREIAEPRRETGARSPEDPIRALAVRRGAEGRAGRTKACRSSGSVIGAESVMNHAGEAQRTRHRCRAYLLPAAFLGEHLGTFRQTCNRYDSITRALEIEDTNPLGVTADFAEFIHLTPKHLALSSHQHDLITVSDLKKPDGK